MVATLLGLSMILTGGAVQRPTVPALGQDPRMPMPAPWIDPGYLQIWWIQSPNYGPRPKNAVVDTIVVYSTVIPTLEATTGAFQRTASQVSAHFTIGKDGSIIQNLSTFDRAWHAGVSEDGEGHKGVNDYSIGIELVNLNDGKDPYPEAQLQALCGIIASMRRRFPIRQIVSHEFIARPVGRKSDPKGFPWERLAYFGLPMHYGEPKVSAPAGG
ncbi:1,6-anhydro-N-acetylmuramyl-L-alanine amidase AmpD [bacterium]|nr:MAG: 1,6-anhydro-N-acetylmuramyl-L-alanine amidase AmpD [bacterium]